MKDFVKWLGVNEKIAKVIVWLLIIMVMLILTNTMLESLGFPYYKITYQNLKSVNINKVLNFSVGYIVAFLNFYSIVLLVFRTKNAKSIFKYAIIYLILNALLSLILPSIIMQIFVIGSIMTFCYYYSGKNWKYAVYGLLACIFNIVIQGIWYMSKARFVDYSSLNYTTKCILSLDYFIIMAIIILVKEVYLKKRGETNGRKRNTNMPILDRRLQERRKIRKETSKKSSKRS